MTTPTNRQNAGKATSEAMKAKNPNFYRENALKAQEAWRKNGRKPRGFSLLSPEEVRKIASKGGKNRKGWRKAEALGPINEVELNRLKTALQDEADMIYSK